MYTIPITTPKCMDGKSSKVFNKIVKKAVNQNTVINDSILEDLDFERKQQIGLILSREEMLEIVDFYIKIKERRKQPHTGDKFELGVIEVLKSKNIAFIHESQKGFPQNKNGCKFDFYLPDFKLYIECKAYYTERLDEQLKAYKDNSVLVIIGQNGIEFLKKLID